MSKKKLTKKELIIKAIKDKEFYKALKKNPKKVFEKELGKKLPANFKVKIVDQKENELFIVIPKISDIKKISKKTLKKITGGSKMPENWYEMSGQEQEEWFRKERLKHTYKK